MSTDQNQLDDVFRALADPTRRRILDQLRLEPMNTKALCEANATMTRGGVINHLQILVAAGLVRVEERGRGRVNHLNATRLQDLHDRWLTTFEQVWASKLRGLGRTAQTIHQEEKPVDERAASVIEIVQQDSCPAPPAAVWDALTTRLSEWWTYPYLSEDSKDLTLTLAPGGTLWDTRSDESGYALATVRGYSPGRELILDGEFAIPGALHGRLVVDIADQGENSSRVTFTHTAMGAIPPSGISGHETSWATLLTHLCDTAIKHYETIDTADQ